MRVSCIIVDEMHPSIVPTLESLGYEVDYRPHITREDLLLEITKYQGLVIRSKTPIDAEIVAAATDLRFIARAGAGLDNLDLEALAQAGVKVVNAPEGNRDTLAEHCMGMLLNLLHNISAADRSVRQGAWEREGFRGTELGGKTVGLIGYGNMGKAFAQRLACFQCKVLAYDKYLTNYSDSIAQEASLETLFEQSQIVSLHVPLTRETRGFYDYSFFHRFHNPIWLLNSARGEILPLSDLVRLINEEKVIGAGLDVLEKEPISQLSDRQSDVFDFLVQSPKIVLTPHVAGWSHQSYQRINAVLVQKLTALQEQGLLD